MRVEAELKDAGSDQLYDFGELAFIHLFSELLAEVVSKRVVHELDEVHEDLLVDHEMRVLPFLV
jgi:hypothetical protein